MDPCRAVDDDGGERETEAYERKKKQRVAQMRDAACDAVVRLKVGVVLDVERLGAELGVRVGDGEIAHRGRK